MRHKIPLALLLMIFCAQAQIVSVQHLADSLQNTPSLKQAQWSVYAKYADYGQIIVELNSEQSLAPASGQKVFTSAAALDILGSDFRFETKLVYDGKINKKGTLAGNIYIIGSGDPTLGSAITKGAPVLDKLMERWVEKIKRTGIRKINGAVIADARIFSGLAVPANWMWEDMGNYYGAGAWGLCMHDNLYFLYLKPGERPGSPVEIMGSKPLVPGLSFANYLQTAEKGSGDNAYIYCAPKQFRAELRGTIPAGAKKFTIKGSIPDPPLFSAQYLQAALFKAGIKATAPARRILPAEKYEPKAQLAATLSPALREIVYMLNKRSINLYAEQLLRAIALRRGKKGDLQSGIETLKTFLKENGISTKGLYLADGCGLSRTNTITTKMMVEFLSKVRQKKYFPDFYNSLGIAGDARDIGYFKNFGKGTLLAHNARIKSGLIQNVRSHSGYLRDRTGRVIVFSLIANNFTEPYAVIDRIHQKLLIKLARLPGI